MSYLVIIRNDQRATALLRWAANFASGNGKSLYILDCRAGHEEKEVVWKRSSESNLESVQYADFIRELEGANGLELHYAAVSSRNAYQTINAQVEQTKSDLLFIDRHLKDDSHGEVEYLKKLLIEVTCAVMMVRLGETDGMNPKVLIPCSGGPNSRLALRMVKKAETLVSTAFFAEPDADEVSLDVGYRRLNKIVARAGLDLDETDKKAVISDDIISAVAAEASTDEYGMVLVGASDASTLRRKLFGTLSEKFLKGKDGTAIGVIRSARPLGHKMRDHFERFLSLSIPQLHREERVALFADIEEKSRWSFDFAALMVLATSIAGLGLLADSGAVVIGAMLVAPLMTPLLGGGLSLVQGNWPLWKRCQAAVLLGFFSALTIGVLLGFGANFFGMHLTGELAARGNPTSLDLGVAFISGLAASYCLARPKLSGALAGVAIAAALVPPIATTGICVAIGELEVARGAALLFGTNVVAIVFGAALNFYAAGIRGRSGVSGIWSKRVFIVFALLCVGLAVPLTSSLITSVTELKDSVATVNAKLTNGVRVTSILSEGVIDGKERVVVKVETSQLLTTDQQQRIVEVLSQLNERALIVRIESVIVSELSTK